MDAYFQNDKLIIHMDYFPSVMYKTYLSQYAGASEHNHRIDIKVY